MPKINNHIKKIINIVVGFGITLFALYIFLFGISVDIGTLNFVVEKIEWKNVWAIISNINPFFLILSIAVTQLVFIFRALRLNIIMSQKMDKFITVLRITILTFGVNNVLPARAGEFLKAYLISKKFKVTIVSAINTNICERLNDGLFMGLLAIVSIRIMMPSFTDPMMLSILPKIEMLSYMGIIFLVVVLIFSFAFKNISFKIFPQSVNTFLNREIHMFRKFLIKPNILDNMKMLLFGAAIWLSLCMGIYLLFGSFSIQAGFLAAIFVQIIIAFSVALPQAPGYLGIFQIGCELALRSFGVDSDTAKSFALILWIVQIVPVTITMAVMAIKGQKIVVENNDSQK